MKRVSKKYKLNDLVYLNTGAKEFRHKAYKIKEISGDKVILDGYKTAKKAVKISGDNTDNFKNVPIYVHISNIVGYNSKTKTPSRIGFKIEGEVKTRILKKTGDKY